MLGVVEHLVEGDDVLVVVKALQDPHLPCNGFQRQPTAGGGHAALADILGGIFTARCLLHTPAHNSKLPAVG